MAVKVAINGFGRIGRNILRAIVENGRTDIEVVAINDLGPVETNAHLLRYDSVHGRFPATVTTTESTIDVGRGPIAVTAIRNPAELPWQHVDIVMECTGIFTDKEKAQIHLENGAEPGAGLRPLQGRRQDHRLRREPRLADRMTSSCPTRPAPRTASRRPPMC
jgi:glyceraldehyde 3-phosphate dehydrogenase